MKYSFEEFVEEEMNEEEALEIFKNLILLPYDWKITDKYKGTINFIGAIEGNEAIEIISNLLEKLQKENEKLKQENKNIKEANHYWSSRYCNIYNNSIPKQKIKDKIEEIQEEGYWLFTTDRDSDKCVEVLQELIKEEEEKQ